MKILKTCLLVLLLTFSAAAQNGGDTLQVDVTKLDANELRVYQALKQKQLEAQTSRVPTVDNLARYAEIGKSFGVAFKECWTTVSDDAGKFAQSDAGKFTMFLIAWKIMAKDTQSIFNDFLSWIVGIGLIVSVSPIFAFITYRNCCVKKRGNVLSKKSLGLFRTEYTYDKPLEPKHVEYIWGYGLCYLVFVVA